MKDWNLVVSIYQDGFKRAFRALRELGSVERSPYHNVLVMTVDNPVALLDAVENQTDVRPALYDAISRVAPAMRSFEFQSCGGIPEQGQGDRARMVAEIGRSVVSCPLPSSRVDA
jgi:hypothetical protein